MKNISEVGAVIIAEILLTRNELLIINHDSSSNSDNSDNNNDNDVLGIQIAAHHQAQLLGRKVPRQDPGQQGRGAEVCLDGAPHRRPQHIPPLARTQHSSCHYHRCVHKSKSLVQYHFNILFLYFISLHIFLYCEVT